MDLRAVNNVLYVQCTQCSTENKCDDEMTGWDNVHEVEAEAVYFLTLTITIYLSRKLHRIEELSYILY